MYENHDLRDIAIFVALFVVIGLGLYYGTMAFLHKTVAAPIFNMQIEDEDVD